MDIQSQVVCAGCRSLLVYPRRATNVRCALCGTVTSIAPSPSLPPPPASDQLICGGCRTLLMYAHGATSVRCSCCNTVNVTRPANQFAHVNCGNCRTTLMYPCGAQSVKCALCQYVTNVGMNNLRVPIPTYRPNGSVTATPSTSAMPQSKSQTVVIENPMSLDGSGKLVSNVAVGVTTEKK